MQPIYYVGAGLKILNHGGGWWVAKLDGDKLKLALDNFLLYEDYRCFTTEKEANDLMNKYNKFKPEPDIKRPVKNPLASDQVVRTMKITTLLQEYKPEQKDK